MDRCYQIYKEQKLKANHNTYWKSRNNYIVVIKYTKNKSWKQITTVMGNRTGKILLLSNIQRTKVESKSQRAFHSGKRTGCCYQIYKEQKLKANHNGKDRCMFITYVVIKYTKNKSWKQITTRTIMEKKLFCCYQIYKEQKLKANHNSSIIKAYKFSVVIKYTKNKSWKQITTQIHIHRQLYRLLSNIQRTKVESKSQLFLVVYKLMDCCYQIYKEQKLKANHNGVVLVKILV